MNLSLLEEPLVGIGSPIFFLLTLLFLFSIPFLLSARWCFLAKEPPVAVFQIFFWGFRGSWYWFSSSSIRAPVVHTPPMSGGNDVQNLIGVARKPSLPSATLNELDQAKCPQQVQMPLDCPD